MSKIIKSLVIASSIFVLGSSTVLAGSSLSKMEAKAQAVEACQTAAKKRYGDNAIKYIGKKAKWMDGMDGASVKMKIKSKRVTKYSCVLQANKIVKFYKA
ncbi:hypothetical protein [uncultured Paraglaciecola sp.]|uniref:hypothetical protein n=1 Tax=uncultured Paraglaciecola sp. TaxID=1765024 RepID=UPI0026309336|nr:hypothetical protein [uncultured Paraglaciecola sp.]